MDAKQKAKELVNRYYHHLAIDFTLYQAKQCAIICVDEIIDELYLMHKPEYVSFYVKTDGDEWDNGCARSEFWQSVKQEIEKL